MSANPNVEVFNRDVSSNEGYVYTKTTRRSSQMATQRSTDIILQMGQFTGRSVIDLGCGDGFYTLRFWDQARPRAMTGVDAAHQAVAVANANKQDRPIQFAVGDAHHLPYPDNGFDVALVQSILHHDDHPDEIIREAFRLAPEILIHEPNGNNYGLKVIEKLSPYHREHNEKSYSSSQLTRWVEQAGGTVVAQRFAGFVPMFSPNWLAYSMKAAEPLVENLPLLRSQGCAVYVLVARRPQTV